MGQKSSAVHTRRVPIQVTPRDITIVLGDGTQGKVRYYPSPNPTRLVLLDAPSQTESEREDVAFYVSAFGVAQVYRLCGDTAASPQEYQARGYALLDALVAAEPNAPTLLGAFSTTHGLECFFPDGYFGARGRVPPPCYISARRGAQLALREYAADAGTVVLVLHGSTTHDRAYAPLARFLTARNLARVFTLTLRGHGLSEGARGDVAYIAQVQDDVADAVAYLRSTTRAKKIILLGHSFGGGVALRFLESCAADAVDGYILLAPYIGSRTPLQNRATHVNTARVFWRNTVPLTIANGLGVTRWHHLPAIEFEILPGFETPMETPRYSYRGWMAGTPSWRVHRALEKLNRPMLVLLSRADELFVVDKLAAFFSGVPRVECVLVTEPTHSGIAFHPQAHAHIAQWLNRQA